METRTITALVAASITASMLFVLPVSAAELKVNTEDISKLLAEAMMNMQQETMAAKYAEMPFKTQMRAQMMLDRASKNYMQNVIQPYMMQKNMEAQMGATKLRLMPDVIFPAFPQPGEAAWLLRVFLYANVRIEHPDRCRAEKKISTAVCLG